MGSTDNESLEVRDVIIIGAGISGCGAAWYLQKQGCSSLILEASDRIGGKTYTVPNGCGDSGHIDLGASWVNDTTQSYINAVIEELELERLEQDISGLAIAQRSDGSFFTHNYHDSVVGPFDHSQRHLDTKTCDAAEKHRRRLRGILRQVSFHRRIDRHGRCRGYPIGG
jgi:monoamine oxidase